MFLNGLYTPFKGTKAHALRQDETLRSGKAMGSATYVLSRGLWRTVHLNSLSMNEMEYIDTLSAL